MDAKHRMTGGPRRFPANARAGPPAGTLASRQTRDHRRARCPGCDGSGTVHVGWCKDVGAIVIHCPVCSAGTRRAPNLTGLYCVMVVIALLLGWLVFF